jgi:iron complex transport system substrate-binding protein
MRQQVALAVSGAVLVFALLLACPVPGAAVGLAITDMAGRQVSFPGRPGRLVALGPGALRLAVYLGVQEQVVGVEQIEKDVREGRPYALAHPRLAELPTVSPGGPAGINKKPDLEGILRVRPEVVFVTYMEAGVAEEVQRLLRVPVVVLSYGRFGTFDEAVYASLRIAGRILGREERAEQVIAYVETGRRDLRQRVAGVPAATRPTVYVGGIGFRGTHGIESTDAEYVPFAWLEARNVVGDRAKEGHLFLDRETLLRLDPEVVFVDGGGLSHIGADYGRRPEYYRLLRAFRERKVFTLYPFNWYMTNVDTVLADAYAVGRILYPERFRDIDLQRRTNEIFRVLAGAPVYNEMEHAYGSLGARPAFLDLAVLGR